MTNISELNISGFKSPNVKWLTYQWHYWHYMQLHNWHHMLWCHSQSHMTVISSWADRVTWIEKSALTMCAWYVTTHFTQCAKGRRADVRQLWISDTAQCKEKNVWFKRKTCVGVWVCSIMALGLDPLAVGSAYVVVVPTPEGIITT